LHLVDEGFSADGPRIVGREWEWAVAHLWNPYLQ
jgi:hypothetical protein